MLFVLTLNTWIWYRHSYSKSKNPVIKGNVLKNEQMALLLGGKDTLISKQLTKIFILTWHNWISYCCSHSKSEKPAIWGNVLKNEQMPLLLGENEQMALLPGKKDTPISKQLTILFVLTWHTRVSYCRSHSKSQKPAIWGNVLKNEQMALLLVGKETTIWKQLTIIFVLTWHTWISYCPSHS